MDACSRAGANSRVQIYMRFILLAYICAIKIQMNAYSRGLRVGRIFKRSVPIRGDAYLIIQCLGLGFLKGRLI